MSIQSCDNMNINNNVSNNAILISINTNFKWLRTIVEKQLELAKIDNIFYEIR